MTTRTSTDIRDHLAAAQSWTASLLAGVSDDQWTLPTPCTELDVRALAEHLLAVQERLLRMGRDGSLGEAPPERIASPESDVAGAFARAAEAAISAWGDERMATAVVAPWGTHPAPVVLGGYVSEHVVHGWDLAVATGQPSEAPGEIADLALHAMRQALPAEGREGLPFSDPVEPAPDAGPTELLANWTGRTSRR